LKQEEHVMTPQTPPQARNQPLPFTPYPLRIARLLLVAALLGAPLAFGAVLPRDWVALGLVAGLALFLWALGSVQQGALKLIWSPLYIPLALFFLLGVAQYAAGLTLDRSLTRQALVLLVVDLTFFFLAVQLFAAAGSRTWRVFGLVVLVFAGSLGLFAISQDVSGVHKIYGIVATPSGDFFGPYVNRDHFAGLMEMLIPVAVLYIAGQHGRLSLEASTWRVSVAALALASLFLTGSRGGLLALAAEILIATIALRRAGARTTERRRSVLAAALTLLAGVMLFAYVEPGWVATKLGSVAYVNSAWADWAGWRKSMTLDSLRMWRDHPVLGVGWGDFGTAYPRYQSFPADMGIDHAHNDYVEAVAETGLVGGLLMLLALGLFLRLAFRDWGHPLRSQASWIRLGAAIGCCGMLVHSLVDFNLHIPANAAWFAVLAGIATTARPSAATEDQVFH
jgi:O-antigen ligase